MKYYEYHERRNDLLRDLRAAEAKYKAVTNFAYTQMAVNGPRIVMARIAEIQQQITTLDAEWQEGLKTKEKRT